MSFTFINWLIGIIVLVLLIAVLSQVPPVVWLFIVAVILIGIINAK